MSGMISVRVNQSAREEPPPCATLPISTTTYNTLGLKSGLRGKDPAADCLINSKVIRTSGCSSQVCLSTEGEQG